MPNSQYPTEPSLAVITGNISQTKSPSRCHKGQKRKGTSLETSPGVGRGGSRLRPLAKRPKPHRQQSSSSSIDAANLFEIPADAENSQAPLFHPTTPARMEPSIGTGGSSKSSGHILTGEAPSGSILVYGDTATSSHSLSVGGEDSLIGLNNPAEDGWGAIPSAKYYRQVYGFEYAGVQADIPSEQGKPLEREWTCGTGPPSATHAWRSHLESISSLAVAISQISRKVQSTTFQPVCEADVETLLQQSENLQQSYFELKKCMQKSMLPSGNALIPCVNPFDGLGSAGISGLGL